MTPYANQQQFNNLPSLEELNSITLLDFYPLAHFHECLHPSKWTRSDWSMWSNSIYEAEDGKSRYETAVNQYRAAIRWDKTLPLVELP